MKEKLLYEWEKKNQLLERDIQENEKKLQYAMERQQDLKRDILFQIFFAIICYFVVQYLFSWRENVPVGFALIFYFTTQIIAIAAMVYNVYQIIIRIMRYFRHTAKLQNWKEPHARVSDQERGIQREATYQAEIEKITWILEQYRNEQRQMGELRHRIEEEDITTLEELERELGKIIIYEMVKSAKK